MACGNRPDVGDESGQVIVLATILMVVLIALTGFAIDVGHAYLVQRQLQAATDAAALAGALELPDQSRAVQFANDYGPAPGSRNPPRSNDNAAITVALKCVTAIPGCKSSSGTVNAVNVRSTSEVKTVFAKIVGFDSFTVKAVATACSPCTEKPLDIMLVLDRTGSMCDTAYQDPNGVWRTRRDCADINNAREGMKTFLRLLDPPLHRVGLTVFPPATSVAARCESRAGNPFSPKYHLRSSAYTIVPLSDDFVSSPGVLNGASDLVSTIECIEADGRTAYADAIDSAQAELDANGRAGVQKVIVFLSDGAANYGPNYYPSDSPYRVQPCHQGIESSKAAQAKKSLVYTIGYDLDGVGDPNLIEECHPDYWRGGQTQDPENPPIKALEAMQGMASGLDTFYNKPDPGQLNTIFTRIATDIFRTAQLIDDSLT